MSQEDEALARIGDISTKIREAIRQALPTPREQFLTIMVPGKVVNFEDYKVDSVNNAILPRQTELNQAILCDDMPPMSSLQMGPTGRSVARSYASAISKLVAAGTTVGVDDGRDKTADQTRYEQAMKFLSTVLLDRSESRTIVELYTEKQSLYTKAVENKTKAFGEALRRAQEDPRNKNTGQIREAYDKWVDENARTYRSYVQAAYMDWVITGKKEEVEYWFSVVDQDSALARVERSKEVMRWAVVQDVDGSCEYQKVKLEPSDWANKCLDKIKKGTNQTKTIEWYNWEISRLEKTVTMLELLVKAPPASTSSTAEALKSEKDAAEAELKTLMESFKTTREAYQGMVSGKFDPSIAEDKKSAEKAAAKGRMDDARGLMQTAEKKLDKLNADNAASQMKDQNSKLFADQGTELSLASKEAASAKKLIADYEKERAKLIEQQGPDKHLVQALSDDFGIPKPAPDPTQAVQQPDPFTPITVSVSSSSDTSASHSSATSFSASASASWGFGHFSASVSHSEAHSDATKELSQAEVNISFECMRVDINRPWLRGELFYDDGLIPATGVELSPGFDALRALMSGPSKGAESELQRYSAFPMYPVAFIVACNVVLEISGSTSKLQTYMNDSSTSASVSVGYGCFSASGSGAHSSSDAGSSCKATASGCRIEIKSPQIIGWVSQLVPALPRIGHK